ncbi:hypothetical protein [Streptomyces sp. NBC_00500]|uniref:hypothetical protein n=1 Tax=unclassified Streptomyces TaxID=2593676 RepID=UPI00386E26AA
MALNESVAEVDRLVESRFRGHELAEAIESMPGIGHSPARRMQQDDCPSDGLRIRATPRFWPRSEAVEVQPGRPVLQFDVRRAPAADGRSDLDPVDVGGVRGAVAELDSLPPSPRLPPLA